jgi:hypothetical protein
MGFADLVAAADRAAQRVLGGVPVTYRPKYGIPVPVTGIFDAQYILADTGADAGVETVGPAVFLQLADLPADPMLDDPLLTIGGTDYRVFERRPADFGSIVLALRKVA